MVSAEEAAGHSGSGNCFCIAKGTPAMGRTRVLGQHCQNSRHVGRTTLVSIFLKAGNTSTHAAELQYHQAASGFACGGATRGWKLQASKLSALAAEACKKLKGGQKGTEDAVFAVPGVFVCMLMWSGKHALNCMQASINVGCMSKIIP
eukprot:1156421-Pelagomonas_calceolata.AAC.19